MGRFQNGSEVLVIMVVMSSIQSGLTLGASTGRVSPQLPILHSFLEFSCGLVSKLRLVSALMLSLMS